jgi:hypothetical protein
MKTIVPVLLACAVFAGACSRSNKKPETATQTTPPLNLRADAKRLQDATAKAAAERKRAMQPSPTPSASQP